MPLTTPGRRSVGEGEMGRREQKMARRRQGCGERDEGEEEEGEEVESAVEGEGAKRARKRDGDRMKGFKASGGRVRRMCRLRVSCCFTPLSMEAE